MRIDSESDATNQTEWSGEKKNGCQEQIRVNLVGT